MSAPPVVSFVVTAYNAERYIGPCVRAALGQTLSDIEVVVLDDGSTDRTADICSEVADPRFRYLPRAHIGRCRALNQAVADARGTYIAINDADDLSLPHRAEYSAGFLRAHPGTAYVGTGFLRTETFGELAPSHIRAAVVSDSTAQPEWPSRSALFRRNLFNNSTLMYPKRTWEKIGGYDEALTNSEDYDFYLRALQCGPAALLSAETVLWYTNPHGFFKQKSKEEHLRALRTIKCRAHELLELPLWMKVYHPLWRVGFELTQRCPGLIEVVRRLRRRGTRVRTTPSRA
jgi:glycosyltransferase involved in cell wall biosynthesis